MPAAIAASRTSCPNATIIEVLNRYAVDGPVRRELTLQRLDAIDGAAVLDIKPHTIEFAPNGHACQPRWFRQLMGGYR
jgi:tRNA (Thr-GGU) A37 N-methylase